MSTILGVLAVFGVGSFIYTEWYSPDIRYQEGSYYTLNQGENNITSILLENFGHTEAENIIIRANFFGHKIKDIAISDTTTPFVILTGGINYTYTGIALERLEPTQKIEVYFNIENTTQDIQDLPQHFISEIRYNGGIGKTGESLLFPILLLMVIGGVEILVAIYVFKFSFVIIRRYFYRHLSCAKAKHCLYNRSRVTGHADNGQAPKT